MPVLVHDDRASQADENFVDSLSRQPVDNAGSVAAPAASAPLPAAIPDVPEIAGIDIADVPVLAQAPRPSRASGWRIERFGAPGADGKGRYWQWRKGRDKERVSAYGGKV